MAGVTVAYTWMSPSSNTHINFTNVSPPPNISLSNEGNGMPVDQLSSRFNPSMAIIVAMVLSTFLLMGFFSVYTRRCILPGRENLLEEVPHRIPSEFVQNQSIQGLDKATIASFPVTSFSLVKGLEKGKAAMECPVCLTDFEGHERIRLLPKCGHAFHLDCIDMWLFSHTNCPLCRQSLIQDPEEFPSMQTFSEATVALESRLEESWRSTQSLAEERYEVRLTLDYAPTQNEVDFNGQDEARSLSRVAEKEATLSLSKKSQLLRIVAQDLEKSEELSSRSVRNLSSSSARYYSKSAKTEDGSPSNSATRSTSPTVIQRLRRKVLRSSQEPEERAACR